METTLAYLPHHLDELFLQNASGGFLGGAPEEDQGRLRIVEKALDQERFIYEAAGDRFSLRQAVSNLYVGGVENKWQLLKLTPEKKECQSWKYHLLPGGQVQIQNHKGNNLAAGEDKRLTWCSNTPLKECWKFVLAKASSSAPAHSSGVGMPQPGKSYGILHKAGGYIGGYKEVKRKMAVVEKLQEFEKWAVETKQDGISLKQITSGLYLGDSNSLNERVGLAEQRQESEVFVLQKKGDNFFTIRNFRGLFLSRRENHVIWTEVESDNELWCFEENIAKPVASPVSDHLYGIQHTSEGGFVGAERSPGCPLKLTPRLEEWEHFYYLDHGGVFGLKQKVSGNFVGLSDSLSDPIGLADRYRQNETFQLSGKGNSLFCIKNHNGYWLSKRGDQIAWSKDCGDNELWRFIPI